MRLVREVLRTVAQTPDPVIEVVFRPVTEQERQSLEGATNRGVAVEVRDNGCGIPKAYQGKIFDPFFSTKDPGMGTGLGLSMVYGLVKEIQEALKMDSKRGEGTTFTLILSTDGVPGEGANV